MWHIAKHILDPKTQSRVQFLTKIEELGLHLSKDSIPKIYGGKYTNKNRFLNPDFYWKRNILGTRVDNSGFSGNYI